MTVKKKKESVQSINGRFQPEAQELTRSMSTAPGPAKRPDEPAVTSSNDLDLVATSYCFVSDDSAFHEMLAAWSRKLDVIAGGGLGSAEEDRLMGGPLRGLSALAERIAKPASRSAVEETVSEVDAPAMVMTTRGTVVTMNGGALDRFGARQGQANAMEWLDPLSKDDFASVAASAGIPNQGRHAIVRTLIDNDQRGFAEVYTVESAPAASCFIAVRALETQWSDSIDTMLQRAFDLTLAERSVARCLYETRDIADVARRRQTSLTTTRTQLRAILAKTDTASQVDLIRLLGLLAARASHGRRGRQDRWRDPWGNEEIIDRPDGRKLAFSWTGAPDGDPALLVHGSVQGYILGPRIEERLIREGVRLFAITRPGFGSSQSDPTVDFADDQTEAIDCLIGKLGFGPIPAIGLGNGSLPLLRLASQTGNRFTRLFVMGLLCSFTDRGLSRLSPVQRALAEFVQFAPRTAELFAKVSDRYVRNQGVDWYLARGWGDVPEVQATLTDPEIIPLIRNACELTLSGTTFDFVREMRTQWHADPADYRNISCPVHHIHGAFDRSVSQEEATSFAALADHFTTEQIPGAGYFLPYEKPDVYADRLIATVKG